MIIVLDTNVVVSGILKPHSKSAVILRLAAEGTVRLAYDLRLLSEYRDVLTRRAFNFTPEEVDSFLTQVEKEGLLVSGKPLKVHLPDPDDEPFLEVALAGKVRALVTGNKRHFPRSHCSGVEVLSPPEFLDAFKILFDTE
jgi:putative PIN family toxin of toxin-antitoxin system